MMCLRISLFGSCSLIGMMFCLVIKKKPGVITVKLIISLDRDCSGLGLGLDFCGLGLGLALVMFVALALDALALALHSVALLTSLDFCHTE